MLWELAALKMASLHGPMTHANGCHINVSPDIYFSPSKRHLPTLPPATMVAHGEAPKPSAS